jgi:hypothetical protein
MSRHLLGVEDRSPEPGFAVEEEKTLWCTPGGQVHGTGNTRTVFDFTRATALRQAIGRSARSSLRGRVRALLGPAEDALTMPQESRRRPGSRLTAIVVFELGIDSEEARALASALFDSGASVMLAELRGWGRTQPNPTGAARKVNWEEFFAYRGFELGKTLLGMRVDDLLSAVQVAGAGRVFVLGVEAAGIVALHAAALSERIAGVATLRTLTSYHDVTQRPGYAEPVSSFVPGALEHYDLPDLERLISPRPCIRLDNHNALRAAMRSGPPLTPIEVAARIKEAW